MPHFFRDLQADFAEEEDPSRCRVYMEVTEGLVVQVAVILVESFHGGSGSRFPARYRSIDGSRVDVWTDGLVDRWTDDWTDGLGGWVEGWKL